MTEFTNAQPNHDPDAPLYSWRVISAGLSFGLFGLGGLVLALTVFPLLLIIPIGSARRQRSSRAILSWLFRQYVRFMELCGLIKLEVRGAEHLQASGQLLIANHPSLLDVVYLISLVSNACCLVKKSMWYNPFTISTVRAAAYIRNDNPELIPQCSRALDAGDSLIIFPEGTRSQQHKPLKFLRGAANIALLAKKDITPISIQVDPPRLMKHHAWYQQSRHTLTVVIECHPPLLIAPYLHTQEIRSRLTRRLTADLEALYRGKS